MENNENFNEKQFTDLARKIFLEKYHVCNLRELIFTIFTLVKINENNDNNKITVRFAKQRACKKIFDKIKYIDDVYDMIARLVKMDNDYKTIKHHKLANYKYLKF